jgi:hypothetical protein
MDAWVSGVACLNDNSWPLCTELLSDLGLWFSDLITITHHFHGSFNTMHPLLLTSGPLYWLFLCLNHFLQMATW